MPSLTLPIKLFVRLEQKDKLRVVIAQNIDGLSDVVLYEEPLDPNNMEAAVHILRMQTY